MAFVTFLVTASARVHGSRSVGLYLTHAVKPKMQRKIPDTAARALSIVDSGLKSTCQSQVHGWMVPIEAVAEQNVRKRSLSRQQGLGAFSEQGPQC